MLSSNKIIRGDKENPYHLSLGQVIINDSNKIALIKKKDGVITLPRETTYLDENYMETLKRGAQSEVGVKVKVIKFLGSLITHFNRDPNTKIEKTTIYFETRVIGKTKKDLTEDELDDVVIWREYNETIKLLHEGNNQEEEIVRRLFEG
jgi:hypothetical protein